jgi:ABC-type uncharacterized transport system auxiliary subunit
LLCAGNPDYLGRLLRRGEVPELLHSPRTAAGGSAGTGRSPRITGVREFRSPTYLQQGAIVYKTSPEQIGFYNYHRWAVDPREFLTNAVADHLRASGNFTQVKLYDGRFDIDCVLSGRLEKVEEIDYEGGVKVEVAISAQMTNLANGATVWSNAVSGVGTVDKRDVPTVVAEIEPNDGTSD